jgi:polar amino acid transport system substrate-binding protein
MKIKLKKMVFCSMATLLTAFMITGCSNSGGSTGSGSGEQTANKTGLMQSIKDKGVLVVGTASGYPPYEFVDTASSDHHVAGIDMALAKAIADKLGVKLKIEDMSFDALLSSLTAGKVDLAIAGINPTDERKKTVDFSDIYLTSHQKLLIRKEDADKFKALDDFNGKTIGAEKNTTQEKLAKSEMPNSSLVALDKVPSLVLELTNKKIDGIVVESIVAQQYLTANPDLTFSDAAFKNDNKDTALAVTKGNDDLLEIINEVIKENKDNGNFNKWIEEYSKLANSNAQ